MELASELVVEKFLASKDVEEVWEGVESVVKTVVKSGAESVEHFG